MHLIIILFVQFTYWKRNQKIIESWDESADEFFDGDDDSIVDIKLSRVEYIEEEATAGEIFTTVETNAEKTRLVIYCL